MSAEFVHPTGLQRRLSAAGYKCIVIASARTPRPKGKRIKTDRRDALELADFLRKGVLTAIRVPTEEEEALRDLLRAREDLKQVETNTKRRIHSLMLRRDRSWSGKSYWTKGHMVWLSSQVFDHPGTTEAHALYMGELRRLGEELKQLDRLVHEIAMTLSSVDLYRALMCMKGIKSFTAATIVAELGDLRRFKTPGQLMSFLGLVPSIYASGMTANYGPITKMGNRRLRRMLVEAAWAYRCSPHVSRELEKRSAGVAKGPREIAWSAQRRLHRKLKSMVARGKRDKVALIAVARELAGFIWAIGQEEILVQPNA